MEVKERTFAQFRRAEVCLRRREECRADKENLVVRRAGTRELLKLKDGDDDRTPAAYTATL